MASLRSYLPAAGSTVWRNERRLTHTSSSEDGDTGLSRTRIKHIVIREVWKREVPSPYALYKIDVMTQSNHWFILRRYREFHLLHQSLVKQYHIPDDMLPSKKLFSNMSLAHLEKRRIALEHYLQRLINSHHDIAESQELFEFLNVQTHDVLCVTRRLAILLEKKGRTILSSGVVFTFSPTQMYCITRQLQLPHVLDEPSDSSNLSEDVVDLGHLYGFIQELRSLCVSGVAKSPCQELISNQAFDISLFKSLQKLQIENCHISVIDGLFRIQKQLTHITLKKCLTSMKEFLIDCAVQKRAVKQAASNVESWRNMSTTKLTDRVVVRPWILLTHINMSHNNISTLDHSLKLLPALEQLDLSHNEFVHVDLEQLTSSTLTFLNLSHNRIHYVSATSRDLRNLKSLLLADNKLQNLDGVECLRGLVELDIRDNGIRGIEELAKISALLHLRILALTGNPCVVSKSYRMQVLCQVKARELILDGIKITEAEKAKMQLVQGRKSVATSPEQSCRDLPGNLKITSADEARPSGSEFRHAQTTQNVKKKIPPFRDDDQDSGFGGNYTGSIDEGGLVFDWGCYSNQADAKRIADSFPYHVAGPSTLISDRALLRSPVFRTKNISNSSDQSNASINCESRGPSDDNVFLNSNMPDNQTYVLSHGSTSPENTYLARNTSIVTSKDDHMPELSDTGQTIESLFPENSDYRGKQLANNPNYKKITKNLTSPLSTLLKQSINDAAESGENEIQRQKPAQSNYPKPKDNWNSSLDEQKITGEHCVWEKGSGNDATSEWDATCGNVIPRESTNCIIDKQHCEDGMSKQISPSLLEDSLSKEVFPTTEIDHTKDCLSKELSPSAHDEKPLPDDCLTMEISPTTHNEQHLTEDCLRKETASTTHNEQRFTEDCLSKETTSATQNDRHLNKDNLCKEISSNTQNNQTLNEDCTSKENRTQDDQHLSKSCISDEVSPNAEDDHPGLSNNYHADENSENNRYHKTLCLEINNELKTTGDGGTDPFFDSTTDCQITYDCQEE